MQDDSAHKSHCSAQNKIHYRLKVSVHTALNLLGVKALFIFFVVFFYNTIATCQHKLDCYHLKMSPHPFNPGSVVLRCDKMGQFLTIYRKALSSTLLSDLRFIHNAHVKTTREKLLKREMDTPSKQIISVFSDSQLRPHGSNVKDGSTC